MAETANREILTNEAIAEHLEQIAEYLSLQDANPHRIRAYHSGANSVRTADQAVGEMAVAANERGDTSELEALPNIGQGLAWLISELVKTGGTEQLRRLRGDMNAEAIFRRVPGVGAVLAQRVIETLGIDTLAELEMAAHDGRLRTVAGFGTERVQAVRDSVATMLTRAGSRRRKQRSEKKPAVATLLVVDEEYRRAAKFDIDRAMALLREAVAPFPKAAMFQLAEEGYTSIFEQLISCIISIRTRDETTIPCAHRLFALARTPAALVKLTVDQIDEAIAASTFHESKAPQMLTIANTILDTYDGELPCDFDVLTAFQGVGPKCANLTLGVACGVPSISVDVHVHRITNRWGYVETGSPETTMRALEKKLSQDYWIEINSLLVPFGKHVCTGSRPRCSTCPLLTMCEQVGVSATR